ncbi:type II toxin-antitoxin system VapC family toxin [Candidatus Poribacteria bacterium]|nr:type II toxin-antitoxin system VapC family toxin [Candidatus Poribacteria bacterium]
MIFVDTGAWIAMLNPNDQYHREAVAIYRPFRQQKTQFLTTDYVIDETVTRLRYDTNHSIAVIFLERIERLVETGVLILVEIDNRIFRGAIALFRQYDSARLSFTDFDDGN